MVAALRQAGVAVTRAGLVAGARGNGRSRVPAPLASALAATAVTLVLDDFHLLTDGAVLSGLTYVMKNA